MRDTPRAPLPPEREPSVAPYTLPYLAPFLTVLSQHSSTAWHSLLPLLFVYVLIPLVDAYVGPSPPEAPLSCAARRRAEQRLSFRAVVLLWAPTQVGMVVWAARRVAVGGGGPLRALALVAATGLISAEGVNCAHELLHRRSRGERALAQLLLVSVCYGHFFIEHARGHHRTVATAEDPATLRFGESFYVFLPRTVCGGFASAWGLEAARLRKAGRRVWGWRNAMLWYVALPGLLYVAPLYAVYGAWAVAAFAGQAAFAVTLLEQINAMEHYGLERERRGEGYEPVGAQHSWDAPHRVSSHFMFKLQRHADHHLHAGKRYQVLELRADSPQLPAGYLTLAPCLLVPPLWRAVMDPVLLEYKARQARAPAAS